MTVGFDVFDRWFWCFWQEVLMILTGGFDDFDRWFWCFWQEVLMILTGGFDGFDSRFWWFWCFDSRFWWFWQVVFVFEGCIINDSRFWCFWWFWQVVLMVLMILTGGFDGFDVLTAGFDVFDDIDRRFLFWRLYFKSCYHDSRFCPLKTLLSGNSPPTHSCVSGSVLWKTVKASPTNICYFKTKSWLFIE